MLKTYLRNTPLVLVLGLVSVIPHGTVQAQIAPDNTLGSENSSVTSGLNVKNLPSERIDGGAVRGTNLFHSFAEFNVGEEQAVYFNNPTGIDNIISRVTGANPSNILGKLGVINGDASLFLLNSHGIIFGANSSLDLGGSFIASTANSLIFADGTQFNSKPTETSPLLTISAPIGLGFDNSSGNIVVQGEGGGARQTNNLIDTQFGLRVAPERTLALLGGNVLIEGGTIKSPGGSIEIGSVSGFGDVGVKTNNGKVYSFDYKNVPTLGEIQLTQQATVDASGFGGGEIQIQGKRLLLADGSQIESSTLSQESGGTLAIRASEVIEITGVSRNNRFIIPSGISAFVYPEATGSGANIKIATERLILENGGSISTATLGIGDGSNLAIQANEIQVIGTLIGGRRAGGIATSTAPIAVGNSGNLEIESNRLIVSNGGTVSTTSLGSGAPGNLLVNAKEFVELVGGANQETPSSLSARSTGTADSGSISVETQRFSILDGARINASNSGNGKGGIVTLVAHLLQLDEGSILVETRSGNSGNINLQVKDFLLARNNSNISATAGIPGNTGDGGNININTGALVALNSSDITANAFEGRGGNIQISTQGLFQSSDSDILASSELGFDGNINIQILEFNVRNSITPLQNNFVSSEQVVAGSCLARRNADRSSFVITGSGGLPANPHSEIQEWENLSGADLTEINTIQLKQPPLNAVNASNIPTKKWKLGDPIVEAQGIIRLPDGRVLLGLKSQEPASAESLTCKG